MPTELSESTPTHRGFTVRQLPGMAFNNRKKDVLKARKTQKRAAKKKVGAAVKHKQQLSLTGGKRTGAQPLEPDKGVAGPRPRLVAAAFA